MIFDTGSEQLAVTGALCDNKSAGKYHFSQEDKFSSALSLEFLQTEESKEDIDKEEFPADKEDKPNDPESKLKNSRCHTQAYNMHQSTSGSNLKKTSTTVSYGSAKLKGFLWKDYTCLQPLSLSEGAGNVTNSTFIAKQESNDSKGYQTDE